MMESAFKVHPDLANVPLGAVHPMGIEVPNLHAVLRGVHERGGVETAWFFEGMPTYLVTGYEDVRRAFLDTDTFSPRATQELFTFPILGPNVPRLRRETTRTSPPSGLASVQPKAVGGLCRVPPGAPGPRDRRSVLRKW